MNTNCFWPCFQKLFQCYYVVEFEAFSLSRIHLGSLGEQNRELSEHVGTCFHVALVIKNLPANAGGIRRQIRSLHWEDHLEEGMATHSSILTWSVPWTEEPGGLHTVNRVTTIQAQLKQLSTLTHNEYYSSYDAICMYIYFLLNMFHKCGIGEGVVLEISTWPSHWNNSYSAI